MSDALSTWLERVIDQSGLHDRHGWSQLLGVSTQAIGRWVSGRDTPRARPLRSLFLILSSADEQDARRRLAEWNDLSKRKLTTVVPSTARIVAPTLAHFVLEPLWEDFVSSVKATSPSVQEEILNSGLAQATQAIVSDNEGRSDQHHPDRTQVSEATMIHLAPSASERFGAEKIASLTHKISQQKTTWCLGMSANM